jgi:hypothetical protein
MSDSPLHKGSLQADGPLTKVELDKLLESCGGPEPGQTLTLGCPQCGNMTISVAYQNGMLVLMCVPCKRQLGLIMVAGAELAMLKSILSRLDCLSQEE